MSGSFHDRAPEPEDRHKLLDAYRVFLGERDGELLPDGRLTRREEQLHDLDGAPGTWDRPMDPTLFRRQLHQFDRRADTTPEMLALLALCRINAGEAYGVEVMRRKRFADLHAGDDPLLQMERLVMQEEDYHTRILVGSTVHFPDIHVQEREPPIMPIRVLIHGLATAPEWLFFPMLLATELAGIRLFLHALHTVSRLFPDHSDIRASMERRLLEVLKDEVGHVAFNRVAAGPRGTAIGLKLAPLVLHGVIQNNPELVALGLDRQTERSLNRLDLRDLPEEVRQAAFFV